MDDVLEQTMLLATAALLVLMGRLSLKTVSQGTDTLDGTTVTFNIS